MRWDEAELEVALQSVAELSGTRLGDSWKTRNVLDSDEAGRGWIKDVLDQGEGRGGKALMWLMRLHPRLPVSHLVFLFCGKILCKLSHGKQVINTRLKKILRTKVSNLLMAKINCSKWLQCSLSAEHGAQNLLSRTHYSCSRLSYPEQPA